MLCKPLFCIVLIGVVLAVVPTASHAQTGISVSPPRTYFTLAPGQSETKKILVTNTSKNHTLELSVSFSDWMYDLAGNNVMQEAGTLPTSCAAWIDVLPQSFFSIAPGASHEIEVRMLVPDTLAEQVPVHTAMLFITQINPIEGVNEQGTNLRVAVRSGVKLYHRRAVEREADLDIVDFAYDADERPHLRLSFENQGNVWTDGTIRCDLLNQETGEKISLDDRIFYTLPGDRRNVSLTLPTSLKAGSYIATAMLDYEHADAVKLAELSFSYGKK